MAEDREREKERGMKGERKCLKSAIERGELTSKQCAMLKSCGRTLREKQVAVVVVLINIYKNIHKIIFVIKFYNNTV